MNEIIIIQNMVNNKENNKGGFCEQAQNRYISPFVEETQIKRQNGGNKCQNMSEEDKQKVREYRKYQNTRKIKLYKLFVVCSIKKK